MSESITNYLSEGIPDNTSSEPVFVFLHGYGSNEYDIAGLSQSIPTATRWVAPRAPMAANYGGFAWAPITVPGNPDQNDIELATSQLWGFLDKFVGTTAPIIAIGFSQGGLMTSQLLRTRPERIKGAGILGGFTLAAAQPADEELKSTKPKVFYSHGEQDQVITSSATTRIKEWLSTHTSATAIDYPGLAHSVDQRVMSDLNNYLANLN